MPFVVERNARSSEVATSVGLSAASIQAYARNGKIPYRRTPGRQYRFNIDEVREILAPVAVTPTDSLQDPFTATTPLVDALSGFRPSPFSESAMHRLALRAHRAEAGPAESREVRQEAGGKQLADLVKRSGNAAAVAVLRRG
ncbi:helix-turn-helix domain-containing protein [Blastococcus sp. CT_GayMR20]|nr:helix-turn-helix domain-containing protein [Blastococcus sp. CT_GayMR20]